MTFRCKAEDPGLNRIPAGRVHLRMLEVLLVLVASDRPVTIYDICDKTGLTRPTALGHLRALEDIYGVKIDKRRPESRTHPTEYTLLDLGLFNPERIRNLLLTQPVPSNKRAGR